MTQLGNPIPRFVWQWRGAFYQLPVTPSDILMLARAVDSEGYPREGVAWALIQRAAWLNTNGKKISLGKLVEQYAQPLNPLWFPTGPKHLAEVARLQRLGDIAGAATEQNRALLRPAKAKKLWHELGAETRQVITDIMVGKSQSPVTGATHYWASRGPDFLSNQARKPDLVLLDPGYGFGPGRNVFFAEKGGAKFGGVKVQDGNGSIPGGGGILTAGMGNGGGPIVIGLLLGYAAWKWFS